MKSKDGIYIALVHFTVRFYSSGQKQCNIFQKRKTVFSSQVLIHIWDKFLCQWLKWDALNKVKSSNVYLNEITLSFWCLLKVNHCLGCRGPWKSQNTTVTKQSQFAAILAEALMCVCVCQSRCVRLIPLVLKPV